MKNLEILLNTYFNDDFNKLKDEALMVIKEKQINYYQEQYWKKIKDFFLYVLNQSTIQDKLYIVLMLNSRNLEKNILKLKPPVFWKEKDNFKNQAEKWNQIKLKRTFRKYI